MPVTARALFTELEFTTLVQDFLTESIELGETDYREANSAADVEAVFARRGRRERYWRSRWNRSATDADSAGEAEDDRRTRD